MVEIMSELGNLIPNISGAGIVGMVAWGLILLITIVVSIVAILLIIRFMKYKYKVVIFENINGRWEPTRRSRAAELPLGKSGDLVFYILKGRKYMPMPSIQTGRRTYWYAIRGDGEWINIGLEDIDLAMKEAKVKYLDKEMRYARTSLQKSLEERYNPKSWFKENWRMIAGLIYMGILGILIWLVFDKWLDLASATTTAVETGEMVLERAGEILSALDNICEGGSGLR